ncbi:unnamed protein product [Phytophthora fragariaefolia]|uniref:Unnamed protein product n=1 Tax=Phytophthora fragariaefolia TaxID=1490495 RepID=A0A9W6X3D5_9STRA|nr:unnamed protein product [Phytophthora fragariaefolia]
MEAVLFRDMRTLLNAGVVGDALLLKLIVTNVFCIIRASDARTQSAPLEDALRLSIRTVTSVMEFLVDSLDAKPVASTNGKPAKDPVVSALRLAGPVTVFCEYLELHPDMIEQLEQLLLHRQKKLYSDVASNDQGAGDQFALVFLETLAKLVSHTRIRELYGPLVATAGHQYNDTRPSAVRDQEHLLKESFELQGFAPLEQDSSAPSWPDEWALQTSSTGANCASPATPLADAESAKIRAWKLYHFARYLCDGYEGDPLLFCGASGQFTTSPVVGKDGSQQNGSSEAFATLNLGFLSSSSSKEQPNQPQRGTVSDYRSGTGVEDDDDFDDEVIVFQPSPALRAMSGSQPAKQHGGFMGTASSPLETLSGGGAFSLRSPSPISPADDQGRMSVSSHSNGFGGTNGSFGASLGYPSFNTFNDAGSFSNNSLLSGWGNSTSVSSNANSGMLRGSLGLDMGFSGSSGLETGFMTPATTTSGSVAGAPSLGFGSRASESRSFAPMVDLAAVERESALYQQRTSSLSAFLSSSTPATQTETQDPSPPRVPTRPPPGFAAASLGVQQKLHTPSLFNP